MAGSSQSGSRGPPIVFASGRRALGLIGGIGAGETMAKKKICPNCGAAEPGSFCRACGQIIDATATPAQKPDPPVRCPNCQTKNKTGSNFCSACGSPIGYSPVGDATNDNAPYNQSSSSGRKPGKKARRAKAKRAKARAKKAKSSRMKWKKKCPNRACRQKITKVMRSQAQCDVCGADWTGFGVTPAARSRDRLTERWVDPPAEVSDTDAASRALYLARIDRMPEHVDPTTGGASIFQRLEAAEGSLARHEQALWDAQGTARELEEAAAGAPPSTRKELRPQIAAARQQELDCGRWLEQARRRVSGVLAELEAVESPSLGLPPSSDGLSDAWFGRRLN